MTNKAKYIPPMADQTDVCLICELLKISEIESDSFEKIKDEGDVIEWE